MQINDTEDVVVLILCLRPIANGPQIVAQVNISCWLYAREDAFLHWCTAMRQLCLLLLVCFNRHNSTSCTEKNGHKKTLLIPIKDEKREAFVVPPWFRSPFYYNPSSGLKL